MTLFEGITSRTIQTPRLVANILERAADNVEDVGEPLVLVHGNVSSSLFWQDLMLRLPSDLRVIAVDLRGFGDSEILPVDATRGLRDFSDDVHSVVETLKLGPVHLMGWSMGGGVAMQYALDHPVRSLILQAPLPPYGFGGTRIDGSRITEDDAGTGAGGVNPEFVARIASKNADPEDTASALSVYRSSYVSEGFHSPHEDIWVESMLSTAVGDGNYPGTSKPSESWPGFAPGDTGVLNSMAPKFHNVSSIVELAEKPPMLWIRGTADAIVADDSFFDIATLGKVGIIPGWPGEDVAPPQQMITQTRNVLDAYRDAGGEVQELTLEGVGHSPHLERPEEVTEAITRFIADR